MVTNYIVQSFQLKGRTLVADAPKSARTGDAAVALAERLGGFKAGAIAFSQDVDIETEAYDDPRVLYRTGTLPAGAFEEN